MKHALALSLTLAVSACTDQPTLSESTAASTVDDWTFENFDEVRPYAKTDPSLYYASIGAIVAAGGTCTAVAKDDTCTSIDPIKDDVTNGAAAAKTGCVSSGRVCQKVGDKWVCFEFTKCCVSMFGQDFCHAVTTTSVSSSPP
jgi:hypothetical protein